MAQVVDQSAPADINGTPASEIPAILGLTQQQSALLVALYNETDPDFAKQIPTALPVAAQQLAAEYEKRNSVGKKVCILGSKPGITRRRKRYLDVQLILLAGTRQGAISRRIQLDRKGTAGSRRAPVKIRRQRRQGSGRLGFGGERTGAWFTAG